MYSREFSDTTEGRVPPHYGGTALGGRRHGEGDGGRHRPAPPPERREERNEERNEERGVGHGRREQREEPCPPPPPPPCEDTAKGRGLSFALRRLLPESIDTGDLLLLGLAILLLSDGCEDEFLPLILLFLLIIH